MKRAQGIGIAASQIPWTSFIKRTTTNPSKQILKITHIPIICSNQSSEFGNWDVQCALCIVWNNIVFAFEFQFDPFCLLLYGRHVGSRVQSLFNVLGKCWRLTGCSDIGLPWLILKLRFQGFWISMIRWGSILSDFSPPKKFAWKGLFGRTLIWSNLTLVGSGGQTGNIWSTFGVPLKTLG